MSLVDWSFMKLSRVAVLSRLRLSGICNALLSRRRKKGKYVFLLESSLSLLVEMFFVSSRTHVRDGPEVRKSCIKQCGVVLFFDLSVR